MNEKPRLGITQHPCNLLTWDLKGTRSHVLTCGNSVASQVQRLEGALAVASASVEGTIQNVTYKDEKSGYTVLKVAALHTLGEPPEQRTSAAQRTPRSGKGASPVPPSLRCLKLLASGLDIPCCLPAASFEPHHLHASL